MLCLGLTGLWYRACQEMILPSASLQATTHPHFRLFLSPLAIGHFVFLYFLKIIRKKNNCLCRRFWIRCYPSAAGILFFGEIGIVQSGFDWNFNDFQWPVSWCRIPEKKHHAHVTFGGAHDNCSHNPKCLMGLRPGGNAVALAYRAYEPQALCQHLRLTL